MGNEYRIYFIVPVFLCIIFLLLRVWSRRYLYYHAAKVRGPFSFPLIGSAYLFFGHTHNSFERFVQLTKHYGHLYKIWFGSQLCFVMNKPEYAHAVLNGTIEKVPHYKFLSPVFGKGLIILPGDEWKIHRKLLNNTFNQQILNGFVGTFTSYSNILNHKLEQNVEEGFFDLVPILTQFTADIIADTIMGVKLNIMEGKGHNLISWTSRLAEIAFSRILNPLLHPDFVWRWTSIGKETENLSQMVHDCISKIVETKRSEKWKSFENKSRKPNFLEHTFKLEDERSTWKEEMTVAETQTIFVAGSDATASTIGFVLMMLGMHQEIQNKVYEELVDVFGDSDRDVVLEDLQQLPYLEMVIKETLRLFPIGPILGRHLNEDINLGNNIFPKGSCVLIPIVSIHRDEKIWPEPLKFDPERFQPGETSRRHPCSYLPFSYGPRNCIGFKYATMAMKSVLATVLRYFKITETEYASISDIQLKADVATKCVKGQKVRLEKR